VLEAPKKGNYIDNSLVRRRLLLEVGKMKMVTNRKQEEHPLSIDYFDLKLLPSSASVF
jgi:hypothetical protein